MATHPYIPLYVDDYDAATAHLTVEEDGAYSRLIRLCWRTPSCSLPNDEAWIARKIRLSAEDFARVAKPVLDEFFTLARGRLVQKRLKKEYDDISRKKTARKQAGKKGGESKALNSKENSPSIASDLLPDTCAFPEPNPEPEPVVSSEDKSSALDDPSATAWKLARALLVERGGATPKAAGSFFGGLLAKHRLDARDLLPALAQAQVSETRDPQSYLTRAAEAVAKRRADHGQPKLVGFV